jgi:hypothetical protein
MHELEKEMHDKSAHFAEIDKQTRSADGEMRKLEQQLRTEMEGMEREMNERSAAAVKQLKAIEDDAIRTKKAEKLL